MRGEDDGLGSFSAGSLPGIMAATLRVSIWRTFDGMRPRMRRPSGMGRKSREFAGLQQLVDRVPAGLASSFSPASPVTHPAKASAGSPGSSST